MRVFTLEGKVIMSRKYRGTVGENQIPMNLEHLDSGTYIIEIIDSGQATDSSPRYAGKVIKR